MTEHIYAARASGDGAAPRRRLHALVHRAVRRRQDDDRGSRRARSSSGAAASSSSSTATTVRDASLEGPRVLEGGPRHEHRAHRLGRLAPDAARRGRDRRGDLALQGDARRRRGRWSRSRATFVEVLRRRVGRRVRRRDVKGLYEKAFKGEIKEFTGVVDPYEEPQNPERAHRDGARGAGGERALHPRAARGART